MKIKFLWLTALAINLITFQTMSQIKEKDYKTTASGLKYVILQKGKGVQPKPGDRVSVHYEGKLMNDTIFDTSYKRGQPFAFVLGQGQVIKGWDEGIALLNEGDSAVFIIPAELGYGSQSMGSIPANSTLKFTVKLMKVTPEVKVEPYNTAGKDTLKTPSGLKLILVSQTNKNNQRPPKGSTVKVHYTGYFEDGKIFDSSVKRGEPISFQVGKGMVIKGWDEGISILKVGDKARLLIPYQLAYGEAGRSPVIPAKANLIFDVELVDFTPEVKPALFDTKGKDTLSTPTGLKYIVVSEGKKDAVKAEAGKKVSVHYTGYFENGDIFDSSVQRGQPLDFDLGKGMVIKGWDEGIGLMKVGDKLRLLIPYQLAYGENGYPGAIPPKSNLVFDVELMGVK
ncbi:MAG: FKBP-type peptidyl-prolyl cis-trans isomerase [Bacteroidia bacterium]|nr:FKBP-type peptidyl-prolyl cis-trans isomerase [Bacteroidia bacterium]